jgi:hypothetical protein
MRKWIGIGLLATLALPAYAQEKEEQRVTCLTTWKFRYSAPLEAGKEALPR